MTPQKNSKVAMHLNGGYIVKGTITRFNQETDVLEITWDKGHRMASDWFIARLSQVAFVDHGDHFAVIY